MSVGELIITAEFALMNQMEGVSERTGFFIKALRMSLPKDAFNESVGVKWLSFNEGYAVENCHR